VKSEPSKRPIALLDRAWSYAWTSSTRIAVRGAMVGGVEVPPVVQLGLARLVVHHRGDAVRVGQREVVDLQLDRQGSVSPVGGHRDRPLVEAAGTVAAV
jgi:hypothetical protein